MKTKKTLNSMDELLDRLTPDEIQSVRSKTGKDILDIFVFICGFETTRAVHISNSLTIEITNAWINGLLVDLILEHRRNRLIGRLLDYSKREKN